MKKLAEKIALVAELCIASVFILTTMFCVTDIVPQQGEWQHNGVTLALMITLSVIFVGLSVYLLYLNFSDRESLKKILLFCDSESATHTNVKAVKKLVDGCAKQVNGVSVKKLRVHSDEKCGLTAVVTVRVNAENVADRINKLRCLLTESFKDTLGLLFNTINFYVERICGKYNHNLQKAEEGAEILSQNQETLTVNYENPMGPQTEPQEAVRTEEQPKKENEENL